LEFIVILFLGIVFYVKIKEAIEEDRLERKAKERFYTNIEVIKEKEDLLLNNYRFYKNLPTDSRRKFIIRLHQFIDGRNFSARGDIEITPEVKMVISAAAVKFSFGLENFQLSGFRRILVYPEEYYSRLTRQYHKGEANAIGVMAFSWKHFQEGLDSPNDNLNLGIHEFAHAYFLQQEKMSGESPFDDGDFNKIRRHINHKALIHEVQGKEIFRDYAFRNEMEFFAILSEHFFETPTQLQTDMPVLYKSLSTVLKQNPVLLGL